MARSPGLSRLLLILAAVLLAHAVVLHRLSHLLEGQAVLVPLAAPLYTRLLRPVAPPPPPSQEEKRPAARVQSGLAAINSIANIPAAATPTVAPPAPAEPQVAAAPSPEAPAAPPVPVAPQPIPEPAPVAPPVAAAPVPAPDTWPADTRLNYRLGGRYRSGELYGNARVLWQREGSRYQVRIEIDVSLAPRLVLTSQGEVEPGGLQPSAYEEFRGSKPRGAKFGPREITLANGNALPRPEGMQDTASQFVELGHRFSTGKEKLEVGRAVAFWMARPGAVDFWTYDIVEREVLRTAKLGDIEAFRLKPRPIANPRGNITMEMWFAPTLQYLPVRIRVNMGDEAQVDLMVESIEQR